MLLNLINKYFNDVFMKFAHNKIFLAGLIGKQQFVDAASLS